MESLPIDVVEDILCRLPVKPLKRFLCVAKSWYSLIDSERFVKWHLKRSLETNSHRRLILGSDKNQIFEVDLDNGGDDLVNTKASVIKPPCSIRVGDLENACNGLFLVSGKPHMMIWNPFTTECKKLPRIEDDDVPFGCYPRIVCGLVWDSRNDDYKVVRVVEHINMYFGVWVGSKTHIYGLKSNSWRQTENFTYHITDLNTDMNGALHTLVYDFTQSNQEPSPAKIVAFSVESERHYDVGFPPLDDSWASHVVNLSLQKLGGCLSLIHTNKFGIVVWVMKDYGVSASWTKMFSFPLKLTELAVMKPLVYTKDGHKVLVCFGCSTFFWLDLRNQTITSVSLEGLPYPINYVEACFESLVSVRSGLVHKQEMDHDKGKDEKMIRDGFPMLSSDDSHKR